MTEHQNPSDKPHRADQAISATLEDVYALARYYTVELYEIGRLWRLHGATGYYQAQMHALERLNRIEEYLGTESFDEVLHGVRASEAARRSRETTRPVKSRDRLNF